MEIKPEITYGTVLTMISMLIIGGIAYGKTENRIDSVEIRLDEMGQTEDKIEKRVDSKLNKIDRRLERIEDLIIGFKK